MTWQCYRVDTTAWGNGAMFEVEDNVVILLYGGHLGRRELRGQLIRVTDNRLVPIDQTVK